ncbi:MAG: hypothetical protein AAGB25_08225 [Pseudomonadota bacterium]
MITAATDGPVFTTSYAQGRAETSVWFPLSVSAMLGLAGLFLNQLPLTAFSAFITLAAIRHWPLTDTQRAVMRLSPDGLDLDGAGRIVWASIDSARFKEISAPKARPRYIEIKLNEPIDVAAIPMPAMRRHPWEIKPWSRRGKLRIFVHLHHLADKSDDVVGAFRHFLGARFFDDVASN